MATSEPFQVDLADPAAIEKALARAEKEVVTRRATVKDAVEQLTRWEALYSRLATIAGQPSASSALGTGSVRERVERVVNESDTPVDVDRVMTLVPGVPRKTIRWNLWDLERKDKIQRVTEGVYARLDFKPETLV